MDSKRKEIFTLNCAQDAVTAEDRRGREDWQQEPGLEAASCDANGSETR